MNIGFIGTGNMASAIVDGLTSEKFIDSKNIFLYNKNKNSSSNLSNKDKTSLSENIYELVESSDYIIFAVKPEVIPSVLKEVLKTRIELKNKVFVSIASGISINEISSLLESNELPIIRLMPNINVKVGEGNTSISKNENVDNEQFEFVKKMFETVGKVWEIKEEQISAFIGISGSLPAIAYIFADIISRVGVKEGFNKDLSTKITTQAILGSMKMLEKSNENPWILVESVSSPGGTTVEGVLDLVSGGFSKNLIKSIETIIEKDKSLLEK